MFIFIYTFYCCYNPVLLCWVFALLWNFPFSFFSFFFLFFFSLFCNFNFWNLLYFFYIYSCVSFPTLLLPLQVIFNVYISILAFFSFFPLLSTYLLVLFSLFIPHLAPCFSFVFRFVLWLFLCLAGKYNFVISFVPLVSLLYFIVFLDCLDFAYGCKCILHIPLF